MILLTRYDVTSHGIHFADYWQGMGVSFSDYDDIVTGIGDTEIEALDDCLEQLAMQHSFDSGVLDQVRIVFLRENPNIEDNTKTIERYCHENDISNDDEWPHYYVSIRYSVDK